MNNPLVEVPSFSNDLERYMRLLWRWAWLIVLATVSGGGSAYLVSRQMTPIYQAATTILVQEPTSLNTSVYDEIVAKEHSVETYTEMIMKNPILDGVVEQLQLGLSRRDLREMLQVTSVRDTELIRVTVDDTDPVRAAAVANAIVLEFSQWYQELQAERYRASKENLEAQLAKLEVETSLVEGRLVDPPSQAEKDRLEALLAQYREMYAFLLQGYEEIRLMESQTTSNILSLEPAEPPTKPIAPEIMQNTMLAAVVGGMLAVGLIFLIEALDDTLRSPEEIARLGLPVLGVIAHNGVENSLPIAISQPRAPVSEAYRSLRTNIQYASIDKAVRTLMVTSPMPEDGKSTVSINLAAVVAQSSRSVAVIDADFRRPKQHRLMRLRNRRGFSDLFLQTDVHLNGCLQVTEASNLMVMTTGPLPPNPSELLSSDKLSEVIHRVQERADMIVIDTPPVLVVTDACVLAPRVDGVVLVVRPGKTKMTLLRETIRQLQHVNGKLLGVVLNDVDLKRSGYYFRGYYHYRYYNSYVETGRVSRRRKARSL